jgi:hypothetical protein
MILVNNPSFYDGGVTDFSGSYHIILGRPCYVKFMAIHSYAYLKLKIPWPTGVITVEVKS